MSLYNISIQRKNGEERQGRYDVPLLNLTEEMRRRSAHRREIIKVKNNIGKTLFVICPDRKGAIVLAKRRIRGHLIEFRLDAKQLAYVCEGL